MKKIVCIIFALLLCLMLACKAPAPAVEPTDAPQTQPPKTSETAATDAPQPAVPTDAPQQPGEEPTDAPAEPTQTADLVFATETLTGEAITSEIVKDYDLVVLNIWAEWCGPCVNELPALEKLHQNYPNVLILGVWVGDSVDEAIATLKDAGVTYPAVQIDEGLYAYVRQTMYIPATFFFDRDGNEVGESVVGGMDYNQWEATVKSLLP